MDSISIISKAKLSKILDEEERTKKNLIDYYKMQEVEGLLYSIWTDKATGNKYAVREFRCVTIGFNTIEEDKVEKFKDIMKREGACKASWGCTGRTLHQMLANQLAKRFPEYRWEIGYNYECTAYDDNWMLEVK